MIRLLDEIGESGFQSAAFLTYGVDLTFFEAKVMSHLQENGCRNVIVMADGHQSKDALNSAALLRYVGVQCPLVTVRLGNRAFHPKALLMVGEEKLKVLVGSGNLTLPGYTRNWEIFTKLEGGEAAGVALQLLDVFGKAAALSPLGEAFAAWRQRVKDSNPWLFGEEADDRSVRLLSSSDAPILPRVKALLGGRKVEEIIVVSPFFDANASALRWLIANFSPERLVLLVDDGAQLDVAHTGEALAMLNGGSAIRRFVREGRPLHGKLLLLRGVWGEALLTGSPNASSAALLERAGWGKGNFEVATFRSGAAGEFSTLVDNKIGELVSLHQMRLRRPHLIGPKVSPLELEAVWVSGGILFALPAEKADRERESLQLRIERGGAETSTLRLDRGEEGSFLKELTDVERFRMEGSTARACLLGPEGEVGPPVWVQNLDAVEKRANPVQRPKYPRGLQALDQGSLGAEWESWNSLFEAFSAFSNSWLRYDTAGRPKSPKPRVDKGASQRDWDPDLFYISRDEVTLELPRYFAKVESSGFAIGDFEYLIGALPSARRSLATGVTYEEESTDALVEEEAAEGEEGEAEASGEIEPSRAEVTKEHLEWLGKRLYKKFRAIIGEYENSLSREPVENKAEASYLCLPYPALQKAIMISAREGLLDVAQFRELASRLTASWTTRFWKEALEKEELEEKLACAATSLTTIATVTAPWLRQLANVDEFDYELYKQLREPLKELRSEFISIMDTYEAGKESPAWERLVAEYNRLRQAEPDQQFFADWTTLQVLDDLARRYKVWNPEETPLWERIVEELDLEGSVRRDANVLRVRAKLPHVGNQDELLGKLLYSIYGGVEDPTAVLWEDESEGVPQWAAMVLCPEHKTVLEIYFRKKRPGVRRHRVTGGSVSNGVHLTAAKYLTFDWWRALIHPRDEDRDLFRCAAELVPELPIAPDSIGHSNTRLRR